MMLFNDSKAFIDWKYRVNKVETCAIGANARPVRIVHAIKAPVVNSPLEIIYTPAITIAIVATWVAKLVMLTLVFDTSLNCMEFFDASLTMFSHRDCKTDSA